MLPVTWKLPPKLGPVFTCQRCWEFFKKAWETPIPGIDKPAGAGDDWRPSLMDSIRHASIAESFKTRDRPK